MSEKLKLEISPSALEEIIHDAILFRLAGYNDPTIVKLKSTDARGSALRTEISQYVIAALRRLSKSN